MAEQFGGRKPIGDGTEYRDLKRPLGAFRLPVDVAGVLSLAGARLALE